MGVSSDIGGTEDVSLMYVSGFFDLIYNNTDKNNKLYGLPNAEGNGPIAYISDSVAISVSCSDVDGAMSFIDTFLSDEVLKRGYEFPISQKIVKENTNATIDSFNKVIDLYRAIFDEAQAHMNGIPYNYATEEDADTLLKCHDNIGRVASSDTSIHQIISKEIQPCFAGDKSLDDVISVMEDKCQTVLDERK